MQYTFRPRNYMGASFQAPRAAPRQRLMEMHQSEHLNSGYCSPFVPKSSNMTSLACWTVLELARWEFLTMYYTDGC